MNAYKHSEISVEKRGGSIDDYYPIHSFLDSTKELCSDNRHRILHNLWGIRRVVIPIFGATIINSDNKKVNVKDLLEQDHILPDYGNKFIPTLFDFSDAINDQNFNIKEIEAVLEKYKNDQPVYRLLLSPLAITGELKSLLFTHNSWFINEIIPLVLNKKPVVHQFLISPNKVFSKMEFKRWMNNGETYPKSAKNIEHIFNYGLFEE